MIPHPIKIGIFGSAEGDFSKIQHLILELGHELGKKNITVITGGATGLPYQIAKVASENGAQVWGYSPAANEKKHKELFPDNSVEIFTKLFFVPESYPLKDNLKASQKYRNVSSTFHCDAGIIISGRWGALNEFTNLFDMGKVIGVLTGSGGIADLLPHLHEQIHKKNSAVVLFD